MATYGLEEVQKALSLGAVDILILSEKLTLFQGKLECSNCNYTEQRTMKKQEINDNEQAIQEELCPKCNSNTFKMIDNQSIIEALGGLAETVGTVVEIISSETEEGEMLYSTFGGIVAILRYKLNY